MDLTLLKKPTAYLPLAMSVAALALVSGFLALYGAERAGDEGAAAHTWQLLMGCQLPLMVFYAVKWLGAAPLRAALILLLQIAAGIAALAPLYLFHR